MMASSGTGLMMLAGPLRCGGAVFVAEINRKSGRQGGAEGSTSSGP